MIILECKDIAKSFPVKRGCPQEKVGSVRALDGVGLSIERGESFGLVGESGCGKTTLGKIILGLIKQDRGTVYLATSRKQAIFQDPFGSLDPKMAVFDILTEGLVINGEPGIRRRAEEALDLVKLPKASLVKYPHQFSGGERQRIAIGRAIITGPEFMVCDEPVSSLDVTIQLQILILLKEIQKRLDITYLFISHDLRVVKFMCEKVAVMRDGKIVEEGSVRHVYSSPSHAYTRQLLSSIPEVYPQQ